MARDAGTRRHRRALCEAKSPAAVRDNLSKCGYAKVSSFPGGPKGGTVACGTNLA